MHCPACGATVMDEAKFCHQCGQAMGGLAGGSEAPPAERFREAAARQQEAPVAEDQELWSGSFSPRAMIGAWVATAALTIALLITLFLLQASGLWWLIGLGVVVVAWLCQFVALVVKRMRDSYVLTSRRFVHESGILIRTTDRIELLDIDDVTVTQGLIERFLGVGTIFIRSTDLTSPKLDLPGIENVKEVAAILDNARLAERRRRGVQIVSNPAEPFPGQ